MSDIAAFFVFVTNHLVLFLCFFSDDYGEKPPSSKVQPGVEDGND